MSKYDVEVKVEILRTYVIEADNPDEAERVVNEVFCLDLDPELGENDRRVISWDTDADSDVSVISERAP